MNEAKAALKGNFPYKEKIKILERYLDNQGLISSYRKAVNQPQIKEAIDFHLRKLRFNPEVKKYQPKGELKKQLSKSVSLPANISDLYDNGSAISKKRDTPGIDDLYPPAIQTAIKERMRFYNQREKIGRELVANVDIWRKVRRAANVAEQRRLHDIINNYSHFINKWKSSGELDFSIIEKPPELSEEDYTALLKQWQDLSRAVSRSKTNAKEALKKGDALKAKYWEGYQKQKEAEQDRIGIIIGKTRRNAYKERTT